MTGHFIECITLPHLNLPQKLPGMSPMVSSLLLLFVVVVQAKGDGWWYEWGSWGACQRKMNNNNKEVYVKKRTRECISFNPLQDASCSGKSTDEALCSHGEWSDWGPWNACKKRGRAAFDPYKKTRTRECTTASCSGKSTEEAYCSHGCRPEDRNLFVPCMCSEQECRAIQSETDNYRWILHAKKLGKKPGEGFCLKNMQ